MNDPVIHPSAAPVVTQQRAEEELRSALEGIVAHWQEQPLSALHELLLPYLASSPRVVIALALTDQDRRWRQGRGIAAEEYFALFPSLYDEPEAAGDLIYAEYVIREARGEDPKIDDFTARFPEYRDMLESQIAFHFFLDEQEALNASPPTRPIRSTEYEILEEIGCGGIGVVYKARHVGLNRLVALKMLRSGPWCSAEQLARFRGEAEAIARLHHPNIVQIYDYGEQDGLPFLALELVEGGTLADRLTGTPWAPRSAVKLLRTLARAVQFAHERGVIHRDLKPANLLLSASPKSTDAALSVAPRDAAIEFGEQQFEIKIADFGLAKSFHSSDHTQTQTGTILGTPSYMAPEQASGHVREIGPAADIYALGAILYHLLTGRPPFHASSAMETLHQVLAQDPISIDRLAPKISRDLSTICYKCLQKEPHQRYATAGELAEDLERLLADQPIRARPVGVMEQCWRWRRRNPVVSTLCGVIGLLMIGITVASAAFSVRLSGQLRKTMSAEKAERAATKDAEVRLWDAYLTEANARQRSGEVGQRFAALEILDKANRLLDRIGRTPQRVFQLRNRVIASLALPDLRLCGEISDLQADRHVVICGAADRYLVREPDGFFSVHSISTGERLLHFSQQGVDSISTLSPDGRYVAGVTGEGAMIWRIDGHEAVIVGKRTPRSQVSFAPSGDLVAFNDANGQMQLLNLASGESVVLGVGSATSTFSFHPSTKRVAVCGETSLLIIDYETGRVISELPKPTSIVPGVAWHPGGNLLAAGCYADEVVLWDVEKKSRALSLQHASSAMSMSFSAGGESLQTHSPWDGQQRLWDTGSGSLLLDLISFGTQENSHARNGELLLVRRLGSRIELWQFEPSKECRALATGLFPSHGLMLNAECTALSSDGRTLAIGRYAALELWDTRSGDRISDLRAGMIRPAFDSHDNLFTASSAGIFRWPRTISPESSNQPSTIQYGPPEVCHGPIRPYSLAVAPSGDLVAGDAPGAGWQLVRRSPESKVVNLGALGDIRHASISKDERFLAVTLWDRALTRVFHANGEPTADLTTGVCGAETFSPDSRWLATTPNGVQLWRTSDWQVVHSLNAWGNTPGGLGVTFSPDSSVLAVGQPNGITRFIEPESGEDIAQFQHPEQECGSYSAFSADQTRFITLGRRRTGRILVWDMVAIREQLSIRGLNWSEEILKCDSSPHTDNGTVHQIALNDAARFNKEQALQLAHEASDESADQALALLDQAMKFDSNNPFIHNQLAWILATASDELRRPNSAVEHARRAIEIKNSESAYYNTLGVALHRAGRFDEAIAAFMQSQKLDPPPTADVYDFLFLALAEERMDHREIAKDWATKAVRSFNDHRSELSERENAELSRFFSELRNSDLPSISE